MRSPHREVGGGGSMGLPPFLRFSLLGMLCLALLSVLDAGVGLLLHRGARAAV